VTANVAVEPGLYAECSEFLIREAELLDNNDLRTWLATFDDAIEYEMPIRVTRERSAGPGFSEQSWHMKETWGSLETRIARLDTAYAWAEDPPSRTRRFVSNIRVEAGDGDDELRVKSNVLTFRSRYDTPEHQLLSAERHDTLRRAEDGRLRLRKRVILLDHTTLGTHNLAIFF
jgi:3-phenylpropionate/cinnamic acid dioxygenase small subunit